MITVGRVSIVSAIFGATVFPSRTRRLSLSMPAYRFARFVGGRCGLWSVRPPGEFFRSKLGAVARTLNRSWPPRPVTSTSSNGRAQSLAVCSTKGMGIAIPTKGCAKTAEDPLSCLVSRNRNQAAARARMNYCHHEPLFRPKPPTSPVCEGNATCGRPFRLYHPPCLFSQPATEQSPPDASTSAECFYELSRDSPPDTRHLVPVPPPVFGFVSRTVLGGKDSLRRNQARRALPSARGYACRQPG
jgi:hypothetical protein